MVELDYIPKPIVNEDGSVSENPIKGKIRIKIPNYVQALELSKKFKFTASPDGVEKANEDDSTIQFLKEIPNYVVNVDLKVHSDDFGEMAVTDLDALSSFEEGKSLINQLGQTIIKGFKLGKR